MARRPCRRRRARFAGQRGDRAAAGSRAATQKTLRGITVQAGWPVPRSLGATVYTGNRDNFTFASCPSICGGRSEKHDSRRPICAKLVVRTVGRTSRWLPFLGSVSEAFGFLYFSALKRSTYTTRINAGRDRTSRQRIQFTGDGPVLWPRKIESVIETQTHSCKYPAGPLTLWLCQTPQQNLRTRWTRVRFGNSNIWHADGESRSRRH